MKKIARKQRVELSPVDVMNDAMMVAEGIRVPMLKPRDPSVWTKTADERRKLKIAKARDNTKFETRWVAHRKQSCPLVANMIFHVIPTDKFPKTTYSFNCPLHEIPRILKKFKKVMVGEYKWNGKTYQREQLPFWRE